MKRKFLVILPLTCLFVACLFSLIGCKTIVHTHKLVKVDYKNATCVEEGNIEYCYCEGCQKFFLDEKYTEITYEDTVIIPLDHDCKEETTVRPTCVEKGEKTFICQREGCGYHYNEDIEIDDDAHKLIHYEKVSATCTVDGIIEHWHCSLCGKNFNDENCEEEVTNLTIIATGHIYLNGDNVCDLCGEVSVSDELGDEVSEVDYSELTYIAWGDSITFGIDGVKWGRMEKPYPTLVAENLGFKSYFNKGVSGATFCSNTLNRTNMTANILAYTGQADIVSVMLGVNDFAVNLPLGTVSDKTNSTIYGSLYLICEHFQKYYGDSFVFFMTPFPYKKGTMKNAEGYLLEDVADAIEFMANEYNYPVLDMFKESNYEIEMNSGLGDGLHPSQEYFIKYGAPKMVSFIKQSVGKQNSRINYNELTYTAFGDSITFGVDGFTGLRMENPYPQAVAKTLNLKSIDNQGVSGSVFCANNQGLTVETNIITSYKKQSDIISVLLGVNDYNRSLPLGKIGDTTNDTLYGSLYLISEYLTKNYKDSFVFFMTPFQEHFHGADCTSKNDAGYTLLDVCNAIKEVANLYEIPVLDLYSVGNYELEMYQSGSDGIHPSQYFVETYTTPVIVDFIKRNYV